MVVDEAGEHVGKVGLWLDGVQLAGLDQGGQHGPLPAAVVGAGEQGAYPVQGYGLDRPLDGVAVELDAFIVDEAAQPLPAGEGRSGLLR